MIPPEDKRRLTVFAVVIILIWCTFAIIIAGVGVADEFAHADVELQDPTGVEIDGDLIQEGGEIEVIVTVSERGNFEKFADAKRGVSIENRFWIIDAFVVTVDTNEVPIYELGYVKGVDRVEANAQIEIDESASAVATSPNGASLTTDTSVDTTYGLAQIGAPDAWSKYDTQGAGVKVAVLDTGVAADHDDLELYTADPDDVTYPGGWAEFDSYGNQIEGSEPHDTAEHGTHVSGTTAGGDASGTYIGVAPEADLMHGLVLPDGSGSVSQIIGGIEWAIENDAQVISMSFGSDGYYSVFIDAIDAANEEGVVVVASIGNSGEGTSSSPGNEYNSIGAGATNEDEDITGISGGELVDTDDAWGSDAPHDWPDEYIVPSVAAPGSWVMSAAPDNKYRYASGTSMAAPHVAGAVVLVQSATVEHHSPDEIREALQETAWKPIDWDENDAADSMDGQDTRYGHGIIDVPAAVEYLQDGHPVFEVQDATLQTDDPILEGETATATATIENVGDAEGDFEAAFLITADGATTTVDTVTVTLAPGESEQVTLEGPVEHAGEYDTEVSGTSMAVLTVEQPATFEVRDARLGETTITEGESVEVSADVENVGDRDGTFTAELVVDGTVVATQDVHVVAGSTETVTFAESFASAGEYDIDVNDAHAGTLTVEEEPEAAFEVSGAALSDGTIEAGDSVDVTATVENVGDAEGSHEVALVVDGQTVGSVTVSLAAGESTTVAFSRTFADAGEYEVAVDDAHAGTLEVLEPADVEVTDAYLDTEAIEEGESVTTTVDLSNAGDVDGDMTVTVDFGDRATVDRTVTVAGGATATETFDHTYDEAGEYEVTADDVVAGTVTVSEPSPAELSVVDATVDPESIIEGETATVEATVENVGDETGDLTVELQLDGAMYDSTTVTLAPGERETVVLEATVADAGEYDVSVDEVAVGTLTVQAAADLEVVDASLSDEEITVGESVEATGVVENTGDVTGTLTVDLEIDGEVVVTTEVEVAAGEFASVVFEWMADDEGDAPVSLNGVYAGTVSVATEDSADDGDDADDGGSGGSGGSGSGGGGAGGGGAGGDAPPPADDPEEETDTETESALATVEATDRGASVLVNDTAAGETVSLDVRDAVANGSVAGGDLTLTGLAIDVDEGAGAFELDVARLTTEPQNGPDLLQYGDGYVGLGYVSIETTVDNAHLEAVRFEFTVSAAALPDGASSEDVTIVRYDGESWQTLETEHEGGDTYSAVSPGFSEFAVAVPASVSAEEDGDDAVFEVRGVDVPERTVAEGEETTVTALVENVGDETGTVTIELTVDGEVRAARDVTIGPGESENVEFTPTFDEVGTYEVSVNGVDEAVAVTVDAADTSDSASAGAAEGPSRNHDDRDIPVALLITGGLFVLGLLVGGVAVAVRGDIDEVTGADGAAAAIGEDPSGEGATNDTGIGVSTSSDRTQAMGARSRSDDGHSDDSGFQWIGDD